MFSKLLAVAVLCVLSPFGSAQQCATPYVSPNYTPSYKSSYTPNYSYYAYQYYTPYYTPYYSTPYYASSTAMQPGSIEQTIKELQNRKLLRDLLKEEAEVNPSTPTVPVAPVTSVPGGAPQLTQDELKRLREILSQNQKK